MCVRRSKEGDGKEAAESFVFNRPPQSQRRSISSRLPFTQCDAPLASVVLMGLTLRRRVWFERPSNGEYQIGWRPEVAIAVDLLPVGVAIETTGTVRYTYRLLMLAAFLGTTLLCPLF